MPTRSWIVQDSRPQAQKPDPIKRGDHAATSLTPGPTHLTPHFSYEELTRTDTGLENDPGMALAGNLLRLAQALEQVRELLGVPMRINSAFRSEKVNRAVGGVDTSHHLFARAADFVPVGMDCGEAFDLIRKSDIDFQQLIHEERNTEWIHLSIPCHHEKGKREVMTARPGRLGRMEYHNA